MASAAAVKIAPETEPEGAERFASTHGRYDRPAGQDLAAGGLGARSLGKLPQAAVSSIDGAGIDGAGIGAAGDQLSDQELRAWRGLLRAHSSLAKLLDSELERLHSLPMTSYEVLRYLDDAPQGRMRMCDLAEQARMSRSGLTRLVDRLEREGLLERCSCEHDARGAYACLTSGGRERLGEARSTHLAVVREHFLSRFSTEELGSLAELWERIAPCCEGC